MLRRPAVSHGTISLLWALGLGGFIFVGMLAIDIAKGTAVIVSIVCAIIIFFVVRLFGEETPRRRPGRPTNG